MGSIYKKKSLKRLPKCSELIEVNGNQKAKWKSRDGKWITREVKKDSNGKLRVVSLSKFYTAKYRDENGRTIEVSTRCREESSARKILSELERKVELIHSGVITREESQVANNNDLSLDKHIHDYLNSLKAAEKSERYQQDCHRLILRVAKDLGWSRLADINPEAIERWLNNRKSEGISPRTRNSYLVAVKTFLNWCVDRGRIIANPLMKVKQVETRTDIRRKRRSLTLDEISRLLYVARLRPLAEYGRETVKKGESADGKRVNWTYQKLHIDSLLATLKKSEERLRNSPGKIAELITLGIERELIYKTLLSTGLRIGELASLCFEHLSIDSDNCYVDLQAANEKNRKGSRIPVRGDLAEDLRRWRDIKQYGIEHASVIVMDNKNQTNTSITGKIFNIPKQMSKVLGQDLKVAGIPKYDERGRSIDVHALRHTFGTMLSKSGVSPRTAQAAMRHSKIDLTMNVYTDPKQLDVLDACESLPKMEKSTFWDALGDAPDFGRGGQNGSLPVYASKLTDDYPGSEQIEKQPINKHKKTSMTTIVTEETKRGGRDSNPQPPDRQSGTLTS